MKVIKTIVIIIAAFYLISCQEEENSSIALPEEYREAIGTYTYTGFSYIEPDYEESEELSGTLLVMEEGNQLIIRMDETPDIILTELAPGIFSEGFGFTIPEADIQDDGLMIKRYGLADVVFDNQGFDGAYDATLDNILFGFIHTITGASSSPVNKVFSFEASKIE